LFFADTARFLAGSGGGGEKEEEERRKALLRRRIHIRFLACGWVSVCICVYGEGGGYFFC